MSLQEIEVGHLKTGQGYLEWRGLRVVGESAMIPLQRLIDGIKLLAVVDLKPMNAGGVSPRITVYPGSWMVRNSV